MEAFEFDIEEWSRSPWPGLFWQQPRMGRSRDIKWSTWPGQVACLTTFDLDLESPGEWEFESVLWETPIQMEAVAGQEMWVGFTWYSYLTCKCYCNPQSQWQMHNLIAFHRFRMVVAVSEEKQRFYLRSHSERILLSIQSLGGCYHPLCANIKSSKARTCKLFHFVHSEKRFLNWKVFLFWMICLQCQLLRRCAHSRKCRMGPTRGRRRTSWEVKSWDRSLLLVIIWSPVAFLKRCDT